MGWFGGVVGSEGGPALFEFFGGWVGVEVASNVHAGDWAKQVGSVDHAWSCDEVRAIH